MSFYISVQNAVEYVESHIEDGELQVGVVCDHVGISRWYFQRIFRGVTGESLGGYIRKRRLSCAALALVNSDRPILDLAISFGFESQEAFSRAFKSHFEVPPAQFRKNQDTQRYLHKFQLTNEHIKHLQEGMTMRPDITESVEIKMVGLSAPFRGVFDDNPNNGKVTPELWQEFMSRVSEVKKRANGNCYGIVRCELKKSQSKSDTDSDSGFEELTYYAMVAVENFDSVPEGMTTFVFPKGRLAKFEHRGSMENLPATIKFIFGTWLPQSNESLREGLELEIYPPDYNPTNPKCSMEYCLALR